MSPEHPRLLVGRDRRSETFDTGSRVLGSVRLSGGPGDTTFGGENGPVALQALRKLD